MAASLPPLGKYGRLFATFENTAGRRRSRRSPDDRRSRVAGTFVEIPYKPRLRLVVSGASRWHSPQTPLALSLPTVCRVVLCSRIQARCTEYFVPSRPHSRALITQGPPNVTPTPKRGHRAREYYTLEFPMSDLKRAGGKHLLPPQTPRVIGKVRSNQLSG